MKHKTLQVLLLAAVAAQPLLAHADHDRGFGWMIGSDRQDGGFGIYHWNGRGWVHMPGAAVEIGGSPLNPWVVNDRGQRFVWNGYGWLPQYNVIRRNDHDRDDYLRSPRFGAQWRDNDHDEWRDRERERDHDRDRDDHRRRDRDDWREREHDRDWHRDGDR